LLLFFTEFIGLFYLYSSVIAIETSVISNFILNDIWTFNDRRKNGKRNFIKRFFNWHLARGLTLLINLFILWSLTNLGLHYLLSNLVGIVIVIALGYFWSLNWVWKKLE